MNALSIYNKNTQNPSLYSTRNKEGATLRSKKKIHVYEGPTYANVPSALNILFAPGDFASSKAALQRARSLEDSEGRLDAGVRLLGTPFSLINGFLSFAITAQEWDLLIKSNFFETKLSVFAKFTGVLGLILCAAEGTFESLGIKRQLKFRKNFSLPSSGNSVDRVRAAIKNLRGIKKKFIDLGKEERAKIHALLREKFPHLSGRAKAEKYRALEEQAREVRINKLARRVKPWCAEEILQRISPILKGVSSPDAPTRKQAEAEALDLAEKIDTQSRKKLIVHIVGLIALIATAVTLCCIMGGIPALVALILLIVASCVSLAKGILSNGWLETPGMEFHWKRGLSFGYCH